MRDPDRGAFELLSQRNEKFCGECIQLLLTVGKRFVELGMKERADPSKKRNASITFLVGESPSSHLRFDGVAVVRRGLDVENHTLDIQLCFGHEFVDLVRYTSGLGSLRR